MRKWIPPLALVAIVTVAFTTGQIVRSGMGVDFSPESIRAWVQALGWKGPAFFLLVVTFRQFLALPSGLLLPVGGLCFGALLGTTLGASGIILSGFFGFGLTRLLGREWAVAHMRGLAQVERRLASAGAPAVWLMTAHPFGVMTPFHWGAGLTSISLVGFSAALLLGGPVRAATYSFLGSTLLDLGSPRFYVASAVLLAVALLPLAHPGIRRRLVTRSVARVVQDRLER
jgi:uncharacterized membrane protein YdjX (TVP38/TMEM64 family)